jgi:hypothetical protein
MTLSTWEQGQPVFGVVHDLVGVALFLPESGSTLAALLEEGLEQDHSEVSVKPRYSRKHRKRQLRAIQ